MLRMQRVAAMGVGVSTLCNVASGRSMRACACLSACGVRVCLMLASALRPRPNMQRRRSRLFPEHPDRRAVRTARTAAHGISP